MILRRCATRGAFEALPEKALKLNLDKIKSKYETIADLPMLIIIKNKGYEITCFKNGKLMIKNCDSKENAEKIFNQIMESAK